MSAPTTPPAGQPVNRVGLTRADYDGSKTTLCPGCGHNAITGGIIQAAWEAGLEPHVVIVGWYLAQLVENLEFHPVGDQTARCMQHHGIERGAPEAPRDTENLHRQWRSPSQAVAAVSPRWCPIVAGMSPATSAMRGCRHNPSLTPERKGASFVMHAPGPRAAGVAREVASH